MKGKITNTRGMALVLTLMVMVLITAMVTEFAYGVYAGTNNLNNWYDSQRLSVLANSGINIASGIVSERASRGNYTYPGFVDMEIESPSKDFDARMNLRILDENSKFNINTIVYPNGAINERAYDTFRKLLSYLSVDSSVAYYVADWIDSDAEERMAGSEKGAKNARLYSVDELMLIKGIDKNVYEKLSPYITVYGDGLININSAEKPVLASLSEKMTDELAQRIIDYRKAAPFEDISQLQKVAGFNLEIYGPLSAGITVKGRCFHVTASADLGGVKRVVEAVIGTGEEIRYWREL